MNITQEQIEALRWLFPNTDVQIDSKLDCICCDFDFCYCCTCHAEMQHILCGEIERAVLAMPDMEVDWNIDKDSYAIRLDWNRRSNDADDWLTARADTKLEAWILAVTELHGRLGK